MGQLWTCLKSYMKPLRSSRGPERSDNVSMDDAQQPILPSQNEYIAMPNFSEASRESFGPRMEPNLVEISEQDLPSYVPPSLSKYTDNKRDAKSTRVILPTIPAEVLLVITSFLPPSSILSLTYSCRAIRQKLGVSAHQILGRSNVCQASSPIEKIDIGDFKFSKFTGKRNVSNSERLELLCLLDRDQMLPSSKAICSGCAATHDRSLFSRHALTQPNHERSCKELAGRTWICPHRVFDHDLVMTSKDSKGKHTCGKYKCENMMVERFFRLMWPLVLLPGLNELPPKNFVGNVMSSLDFPICDHIRSSDEFVRNFYSPDCRKLRWPAIYEAPDAPCQCSSCALLPPPPTREQWAHAIEYRRLDQLLDDYDGRRCHICRCIFTFSTCWSIKSSYVLQLVVRSKSETFRECTDPAWIRQMTDPTEIGRLERAWDVATMSPMGSERYDSPTRSLPKQL